MSDQDATIFEGTQNQEPVATNNEAPQAPAAPTIPDGVSEFVGEGKKYATVEDALKSVPHAQQHISQLEQEMAQLKEELTKRKTAEEVLDRLTPTNQQDPEKPSVPSVSPDEIDSRVEALLAKREAMSKAQANTQTVREKLVEKFGEKAEEMYKKAAQDAGMSVETFNQLSASSPMAVLKLVGMDSKPQPTPSPTKGNVNTEAFQQGKLQGEAPKLGIGATTKDMVASWNYHASKVTEQ